MINDDGDDDGDDGDDDKEDSEPVEMFPKNDEALEENLLTVLDTEEKEDD